MTHAEKSRNGWRKKHPAEAKRMNFAVPIIQASADLRGFYGLSERHEHNPGSTRCVMIVRTASLEQSSIPMLSKPIFNERLFGGDFLHPVGGGGRLRSEKSRFS